MAAQAGGRPAVPPPPRVHAAAPLTAPLPPLRSALVRPPPPPALLHPVSLQSPRPDAERALNEYVETPFRPPPVSPHQHLHHHLHHNHQQQQPHQQQQQQQQSSPPPPLSTDAKPHARTARLQLPLTHQQLPPSTIPTHHAGSGLLAPASLPLSLPLSGATAATTVVTKQPVAFTKEQPTRAPLGTDCASSSNIMCRECGRCRCESCRAPRALPERWLCHEACLCSAGALIDYASCLCCVKGLYYHCSNSDAGATCADEPCSCGPHRRVARWACLGALVALLPCLLCYWPLRVCQRAVEAAYARHSRAGCRCRPATIASSAPSLATPEKRLLSDASPDL